MTSLNDVSRTCIVQTFVMMGPFDDIISIIDRDVRDFIDERQKNYWYIQHIQNTVIPGNTEGNTRYIVHLVMSRMDNSTYSSG